MEREIAQALLTALDPTLVPVATAPAVLMARDAAQLLSLPGLDRLLAVLQVHAGGRWPEEVLPAFERVQRLAAVSAGAGNLEAFRAADRELEAMAAQLQALEWSEQPGDHGARVPTLRLVDVIDDLPIADGPSRDAWKRTRVTAPVAAALRASLDWLTVDRAAAAPLRLAAREAALEIVIERIDEGGVWAASRVLSSVGGNLGPLRGKIGSVFAAGPWRLRVPAATARLSYLMVTQGDLNLALPWHAVLQICMVPEAGLEQGLRNLGYPLLAPLVPLAGAASEHPMALIAHGVKRAYLRADRLIWRLEADPLEFGEAPPMSSLTHAVRTDEDEVFWVADPALLLEAIEAPPLSSARTAAEPGDEALPVLDSRDVEPLARSVAVEMAAAALAPSVPAAQRPRALVAEDSLGARTQLVRLLEQRGFVTTGVGTAAALSAELMNGGWALVCVDVELPDARGAELLAAARMVLGHGALVALVRDDEDRAAARAAGITHVIEKPFETDAVTRALRATGLLEGEAR
jgi:CheY-like chemotaxis protein